MRTTKPISSISFNSADFLKLKLNELVKAGRLSFWAFIAHKPEDDEGGKKSHIHLYCEPSKMLQTDELRAEFKEFDPEHPDKPLGTLTFDSSIFSHWYLYVLHDSRYLKSKGQTRVHHYTAEEIISSDEDDLNRKVKSIDLLSVSPYADMESAIKQGVTWEEYFARGTVPILQIRQFRDAWYFLLAGQSRNERTNRNGRPNHPMTPDGDLINPDTGEVTEDPLNDLPDQK